MAAQDLLIVGAGGHARVVIDIAETSGLVICGILDINYREQSEKIFGYEVIGGFSRLQDFRADETAVAIAIGDNDTRASHFMAVRNRGHDVPSLVHPTATVSQHAKLGTGVLINAAVVVNAGVRIDDDVIINSGAIIEHEVEISAHAHVASGARVAGRVNIGEEAFVGTGAILVRKVNVGAHAIIGAGSVIIEDVEPHATVVGVPGKRIK